ncbi:hypothetical protein ZWY2020_025233 [Hordeum vulgare]|nr:hypothetical protein ZWY2020_025233 [Hordeum vulgare]
MHAYAGLQRAWREAELGLSVIDSYMLLRRTEVDDEDFYLACVLGWCIEWLQASALVLDDITDNAYTRRDNLCWYKLPTVGLSAINDGVLLKCHVQAIIKRYFKEKLLQTAMGQMLDLITTHTGAKDLARYRIQGYRRIVKYKTSHYSFYLPVACALLLNGVEAEDYVETDIEDYKCSWLIVQAMELANENEMKILYENYGKSSQNVSQQ